jgi:signal transduction histidine kinase/CheY-like chemotaxis protein
MMHADEMASPAKPPSRPDRRTLTSMIATAGVVLLLMAGAVMVVYNERFYRETKLQQADVQARILASTVSAALQFDDQKAAHEYVHALAGDAEIEAAAVYDGQGVLFADYVRAGARPPAVLAQIGPNFEGDSLTVTVPVTQGDRRLGTVYMRSIVAPIFRRVAQYMVIGFLVAMGTLILVVLGLAQSRLADVNARLKRQSGDLAHANEVLRAEIEQRERAETALRQAQKMEAIGQLTGGIAHDFNNLLQVIVGNLDVLQRRVHDAPEDVRRMIAAARRGAERATTLTQRLLAFSRLQPLNPQPVEVNKLVSGMSELLRRTLGESVRVDNALTRDVWPIAVDANQLENALINLAVNGRDAMPEGGSLVIQTGNAHLDHVLRGPDDAAPGDYVVIAVTDTGAGMDKDVLSKAVEPFFTTKGIGKGSGLGLSQVYGFVRQSGGRLDIESEPGRGTTVKLFLPRLTASQRPPEPRAELPVAVHTPMDGVILVVEDEDDVRAQVVAVLRDLGYTVFEAADAAAALTLLDTQPAVQLLFTDVGLPGGMNGRQLAEEARVRRPELRILFTSGYARHAIVHHGRLDPDVELLAKPFSSAELAEKVYGMLADAGPADGSGGAAHMRSASS